MSELVPAANKSVALPIESVEKFRADANKLAALLQSDSIVQVERGIEQIPDIERKFRAIKQPISERELAVEIAMIIAAFPNTRAAEDFAKILLASVAVMRPCVGSVKLACRHLIFTAKFLPAIAEVREAIKEQVRWIANLEQNIGRLPAHLRNLKSEKASEHRRELVECFYRLERWHTTEWEDEAEKAKRRAEIVADYDPDTVADAQARVDAGCWYRASSGWFANGERWVDPRGLIDARAVEGNA